MASEPALMPWCAPGCVLSMGHGEEALRRLRCALLAGPALRELRADKVSADSCGAVWTPDAGTYEPRGRT
jgi:hypothetical protein